MASKRRLVPKERMAKALPHQRIKSNNESVGVSMRQCCGEDSVFARAPPPWPISEANSACDEEKGCGLSRNEMKTNIAAKMTFHAGSWKLKGEGSEATATISQSIKSEGR